MFVGRERDLRDLEALWGRDHGVLVTCRGRRRIGKSTLVEEFAARSAERFICIEGLPPRKGMTDATQRRHFCEKVAEYSGKEPIFAPTWSLAFAQLDGIIPDGRRTVVLLDEISWIGGYDPDFAGYLKEAWDRRFRKHAELVFVICGSVSAWIAENILDSTGFVGRDSLDIELKELPPAQCQLMLGPAGERMATREKIDLLSVTGGIPKYIEDVRPELSVDENVRRMCFMPRGILFREFDETFNGVFGRKAHVRGTILRKLASGPKSAADLAKTDGKTPNGSYARALRELEMAGYVAGDAGLNPMTGEPLREERFRICDNYTRFYLHCIEPRRTMIANDLFEFTSLEQVRGIDTLFGLQFENLVLNNLKILFPMLGLEESLVLSAAPYCRRQSKTSGGCQIDLLIQTQRTLIAVEIKRRREIGREIIAEMDAKLQNLKFAQGLFLRTALIFDGRLSPAVPAERYFDFIVPAERFFAN